MKIIRPASIPDSGAFTGPATGRTYYDKTGALQTAALNIPRFTYDPADLTKPPIFMLDSSVGEACTLGLVSLLSENDYATYSATKGYVTGDRIIVLSNHTIYESVNGVRSTSITTSTSGGVVNWVAHGFALNDTVIFESGTAPAGITLNTPYYVWSIPNANSFTLATTKNAATNISIGTSTGSLTVVGTKNYAVDPTGTTASGIWIKVKSTNKWAVFDQSVESQTTATDAIMWALQTPTTSLVDSIVLQNVNGLRVRVAMITPTDGIVYDKIVDMTSTEGISDPYLYSFEPIVRNTDVVFANLPPYANAYISVSIIGSSGETVGCGLCIMGLSKTFGPTQAGMSLGSTDYSVKEKSDYGVTTIQERPYAKTMTLTCFVDRSKMNILFNLLNQFRATPIVYIGDETLTSSVQYGFYKDYSMGAEYPETSVLHIEIESLT